MSNLTEQILRGTIEAQEKIQETQNISSDCFDNNIISTSSNEEVYMDNLFSTIETCDKICKTEFDEENTSIMVLYAYMDTQTSQRLFKYFVGQKFNMTQHYRNQNPLQIPITLYESKDNAKILATPTNSQLVAFSISNNTGWMYDEFDLNLKNRIKSLNITVKQYKEQAIIWREKKKYNNLEYIAYTIRNKNTIKEIQLQD